MTQDYKHPITPPEELVRAWASLVEPHGIADVFASIAQWGSDQELEACCAVLDGLGYEETITSNQLHAARRPKPPSLKEQALDAHNRMMAGEETQDDWGIVRRALEQLDD